MNEPLASAPRPCAVPHSAPAAWLKSASPLEGEDQGGGRPASGGHENLLPPPHPPHEGEGSGDPLTPDEEQRHKIDAFLAAYEGIAPEAERRGGWTPFLRKLFLQVISETGKVTFACACAGMSRQSAYALAARDRVFATGWDAASHFARMPLADDLYEKGLEGITETVTRSDGVTVTRHRYDGRLSIAVLNRLDRRCDRAEERGAKHLAAVRNWDEYLKLIGQGDDTAAEAILDTAPHCQTCQLAERADPIPSPSPPDCDPSEYVWPAGSAEDLRPDRAHALPGGTWMTNFPPPPGFDGYENTTWDGFTWYERACSPEEAELLDANEAAALAEEDAELTAFAEAEREEFFATLRGALNRHPGLGSRQSNTLMGALEPGPAFSFGAGEGRQAPDQVRGDDVSPDSP